MRAILIAATALTVLSIPAHAQVDHMNLTYPACVTPLHFDEAEALARAGRPMNPDFCLILKEGTEVVRVRSIGSYEQIAYQVDDGTVAGRTLTLFTNPRALKGVVSEERIFKEKVKKEADERNRQQWADLEWSSRANDDLKALIGKHNDCVLVFSTSNPICKGIEGAVPDLRLEIISRPVH